MMRRHGVIHSIRVASQLIRRMHDSECERVTLDQTQQLSYAFLLVTWLFLLAYEGQRRKMLPRSHPKLAKKIKESFHLRLRS